MHILNSNHFNKNDFFLYRKAIYSIMSIYTVMENNKPDGETGEPKWRRHQTIVVKD